MAAARLVGWCRVKDGRGCDRECWRKRPAVAVRPGARARGLWGRVWGGAVQTDLAMRVARIGPTYQARGKHLVPGPSQLVCATDTAAATATHAQHSARPGAWASASRLRARRTAPCSMPRSGPQKEPWRPSATRETPQQLGTNACVLARLGSRRSGHVAACQREHICELPAPLARPRLRAILATTPAC
jgi:hypothetical protein